MPPRAKNLSDGFDSFSEDDYLLRNLGCIAQDPEVALIELVGQRMGRRRVSGRYHYPLRFRSVVS